MEISYVSVFFLIIIQGFCLFFLNYPPNSQMPRVGARAAGRVIR